MTAHEIGLAFARLGLEIGRYLPGYVESYYGPPNIQETVHSQGKIPLGELETIAERLVEEVTAGTYLQAARREFLLGEIAAMRTTLRILGGESLNIVEEVRRLYGVVPAWTDESRFTEAHRALDHILPGVAPLSERVQAFRERLLVPAKVAAPIINRLGVDFRERTRALLPLPEGESCVFSFVRDKPWAAYNWYEGEGSSRIEFNEEHPIDIRKLPNVVAHESYPGHHVEHAIKEETLYRKEGRLEHAIVLTNVPSCLVGEGIAESALSMIVGPDDLVPLYAEILQEAGLPPQEAARIHEFDSALLPLNRVSDNQLLLLYEEGASDQEVLGYGRRYALTTEDKERLLLRFAKDPLWRSYGFNYSLGKDLVDAYLSASPDRTEAFVGLLREPMTPAQIRSAAS